jgi:hypothetical protein
MKKYIVLFVIEFLVLNVNAQGFRHEMMVLPDEYKHYIINSDMETDLLSPNKSGWYYSQAGIVTTPSGYVAAYRKSDFHTANTTDIMIAYSKDAKNWSGHHSISHMDVWNQQGAWVAPQFSQLKDGRLVILSDLGQRNTGQDWPMLSDWQKPGRGMSNHLFWSDDEGKTWTGPNKVDDVGGEPGYITEMENGNLLYTRTFSDKTNKLWKPVMPWGNIYYKNESVLSKDGGKTWEKPVIVADNPFHGDCEVGTVEYTPGKLLAITRIGHGAGRFIQPSRFVYSQDGGQSWGEPVLAPIYGQRVIVHKLLSGKLLAVYRNNWGTPGTYAFLFDANEKFDYQPSTFIFEESRSKLQDGILSLKTGRNVKEQVIYGFYPAQSPEANVLIEAELKIAEADIHGFNISAGCWIRFLPDRICLADRPDIGFDIDATSWHTYKIERNKGKLRIYVDGKIKLNVSVADMENKYVQIGSRMVKGFNFTNIDNDKSVETETKSFVQIRSMHVSVDNKEDYDIDWHWDASKGYPDQFRKDRLVALDIIAATASHCGYSGFTQNPDGTIVIADYTVGGNGNKPSSMPFIRAYVVTEDILTVKK